MTHMDSGNHQNAKFQIIEKGLENNMSIMTLDPSGILTSYNKMSAILFGYSTDELLFKKTADVFCDSTDLDSESKKIATALSLEGIGFSVLLEKAKRDGRLDFDLNGVRDGGSKFPAGFSVIAIHSDSKELIGFLLLAKDLTQKRRQEKAQEQQRATMASSSKLASLGEMAGGVAHEVNNPLAIILGKAAKLIQIMKTSSEPRKDEIVRDLEKIMTGSERIAKIIKGLRAFSRSADTDPLQKAYVHDIIDDAISFCSARFKDQGIDFKIGDLPKIMISCRATQLAQVVLSMLNNSFDAIQPLKEKWIKIEVLPTLDNKVDIVITDSGGGIPKEIAEKLMQPFFTTKEVGKGTGLGLSVSRGIIHDHGGILTLDQECKNTRFIIQLPTIQ